MRFLVGEIHYYRIYPGSMRHVILPAGADSVLE